MYSDLTTVKKVNGIPVDLRYFDQLNQNDSFFKSVSDIDEDLANLDRDIFPTIDNTFDIGEVSKAFKNIYAHNLLTEYVNLLAGTLASPSLMIGTAGLTSLNNNELSFIGSTGLESIKFMTSGLLVKAANNSQLKIENTLPGSESLWALGCDEKGLKLGDSVLVKDTSTNILNLLKIQSGTLDAPGLSFVSDPTTGISKDISDAILNFSLSGVNRLALSSNALELLSSQLVLPLSNPGQTSLAFTGYLGTGLSSTDGSDINLVINNNQLFSFNEGGLESKLTLNSEFNFKVASDTAFHKFSFSKAMGNHSLREPVLNDDILFEGSFKGYDGTDYISGAQIAIQSEEDYGATFGTSIYLRSCAVGESSIEDRFAIGQKLKADVHIPSSIGMDKVIITGPSTGVQVNVRHISKIMIDATAGNIEIKGFIGGQEGQMLYLYKKVPTNTFSLLFNSATATQKILLKDSTDYTNTNNYGGITLSFDDGIWREISRS